MNIIVKYMSLWAFCVLSSCDIDHRVSLEKFDVNLNIILAIHQDLPLYFTNMVKTLIQLYAVSLLFLLD